MNKTYLYIVMFSSMHLQGKEIESPHDLPPEIEMLKKKHEKHTLEQVLNIETESCHCAHYMGKKFIACMAYAEKEDVRDTFSRMTVEARIHYLYAMNLFEYAHFLDAFENEQQWKATLNSLTKEERKKLPQSKREQLIMIRDTWLECSRQSFGFYRSGTKEPKAEDLKSWRNKALKGMEKHGKKTKIFLNWLNERFVEKKSKLLS